MFWRVLNRPWAKPLQERFETFMSWRWGQPPQPDPGAESRPEEAMRFVARVMSLIFLVVAVIAGLVDAIQSVAAHKPIFTPLIQSWNEASPATLELVADLFAGHLPLWVWDPAAIWVMAQPSFAVFLGLSLLFYLIGYRRKKPAGRFAA
jgi:hypothetical protein